MANWNNLKQAIKTSIYSNGNQEITGALLQSVLLNIISSIGEHASFAGMASTTMNPGTPDGSVFYICSEHGVYSNFGSIEVSQEEIGALLVWKDGKWSKTRSLLSISNSIGDSQTKVMSQKAVTEQLNMVNTEIGASSENVELKLSLNAYSNYTINIPKGAVFTSLGDYNYGEIILVKAGGESFERFSYTKLPYTVQNDIYMLRTTSNIDTTVAYTTPNSGIFKRIELLESGEAIKDEAIQRRHLSEEIIIPEVAQAIGDSQTKVMSQKAVTDAIDFSSSIIFSDKNVTPTAASTRIQIGNTLKAGETYHVTLDFRIKTGRLSYLATNTTASGDYVDMIMPDIYKKEGVIHAMYTPTTDVDYWYIILASDFVYDAESLIKIKAYQVSSLNEVSRKLESKVEDGFNSINKKIGDDSKYVITPISARAFSTLQFSIRKGSKITNFGGYTGELLLSSTTTFESPNFERVTASNLPYTVKSDIEYLRATKDIDNDITYYEDADGLIGRVEKLEKKGIEHHEIPTIRGNMQNGTTFSLQKNSVKSNDIFLFTAKINSFSGIRIGRGKPSEKGYSSSWIDINDSSIIVTKYYNSESSTTYAHGLTIANDISVIVSVGLNGQATITISSNGESFAKNISWIGCNGTIFAESLNSNLENVVFSWYCSSFKSDIWMFGDSYFNMTDSARWTSYLVSMGFTNILFNGYPGAKSNNGFSDLTQLLKIAKPKYIVWCLGQNNADSEDNINVTWLDNYNSFIELCNSQGIIPILSTTPTVKGGYVEDTQDYKKRIHKWKNQIVRNSGFRYIDFDMAVGADEETGEWYAGMLSSDGVHPTNKGAITLFMRAMADFPELAIAKV